MSHHCACRGAGRSQAVGRVAWFLASSCVQAPTCNVSVFQSASLRHNLGPTNSSSRPLTRRLNKGVGPAIAFRSLSGSARLVQFASGVVIGRAHRHQRRNRFFASSLFLVALVALGQAHRHQWRNRISHHCACRGAGRSQAVGRVAWFLASSCVQAPTCKVSVFQSASLRHNLGPTSSSSRPLTRRLNKGVGPAIAFRSLSGSARLVQFASSVVIGRAHRHQRRNRFIASSLFLVALVALGQAHRHQRRNRMSHHCACRGAGRSQAVDGVAWFLASSCVQAPTCNVSVFQSASLRHNLGPTSSSSRPLTRRLNKVLGRL